MNLQSDITDLALRFTVCTLNTKSYDLLIEFVKVLKKYNHIYINNNVINIHDIDLFYNNHSRKDNSRNNKIRELIIQSIINKQIPSLWYILNKRWKCFSESVYRFVDSLEPVYDNIICILRGGRSYNYDFDFEYHIKKSCVIHHVEFKYGTKKISACPQFLSLSAKFNTEYASYYYDNYLPTIAKLYSLKLPSKTTYLSYVYQTNYNKHRFFKKLYEHEEMFIKEKKVLVDTSIHEFLSTFTLDIDQLNKKIMETQSKKYYMCCYKGNIQIDTISDDELIVTGIKCLKANVNKLNTSIVLSTKTSTTIQMLLRWRNHYGVLNPAWQISIHRNTS